MGRSTFRRAWQCQNATAFAYKELTFSLARGGKQRRPVDRPQLADTKSIFGAGEEIRTLDLNLGKVSSGYQYTRMYAALTRIALSPSAACLCRPTLSIPRYYCRPSSEDFRTARTKAIVPRSDCLWKPMAPSMSRQRRHNTPETETSSTEFSGLRRARTRHPTRG